ncbi:MAG: hypothetical protein WC479_10225 [Candidatus Izemoplasmatales bacterium]
MMNRQSKEDKMKHDIYAIQEEIGVKGEYNVELAGGIWFLDAPWSIGVISSLSGSSFKKMCKAFFIGIKCARESIKSDIKSFFED